MKSSFHFMHRLALPPAKQILSLENLLKNRGHLWFGPIAQPG